MPAARLQHTPAKKYALCLLAVGTHCAGGGMKLTFNVADDCAVEVQDTELTPSPSIMPVGQEAITEAASPEPSPTQMATAAPTPTPTLAPVPCGYDAMRLLPSALTHVCAWGLATCHLLN